jgi:quercetin dioxygenase-like cupin family protein
MLKGSASAVAAAMLIAVGLMGCVDRAAGPAAAASQPEAPLTRLATDAALQWGPCPDIFPTGCEIAVLHGNPAEPNADVFLRAQGGGTRLPAHTHTSAERMTLVAGELNVHYEGAAATTLTVGEYAYGPAGLPHEATCVSAEACVLFIAFEGPVDAMLHEGAIE